MFSFKLLNVYKCLSYHDVSHDKIKWYGLGIGVYFF